MSEAIRTILFWPAVSLLILLILVLVIGYLLIMRTPHD